MEVRQRRFQPLTQKSSETNFSPKKVQDTLDISHVLVLAAFAVILVVATNIADTRMPVVRSGGDFSGFSESRARPLIKKLAALGPHPSGSDALEIDAVRIILDELDYIKGAVSEVHKLEIDVQRPSDCFDIHFGDSYSMCYYKISNIVARFGPQGSPTEHAVLLNCHFDSQPDAPGATDDAVSCAVMMDVLNTMVHKRIKLKNDIIFLFNGAEESCLQGAHGFIAQHPWRHSVRAFINLEGTGAGGRELLFQAGPGNSWLLETYLNSAIHPACSVIAQELFQSGVIPSDTDFRIFRDFGRIPGLDIAYNKNGWVYHSEFDTEDRIGVGNVQRAGDNILAVAIALGTRASYEPSSFNATNEYVFFDYLGVFAVRYSVTAGTVINFIVIAIAIGFARYNVNVRAFKFGQLASAFLRHGVLLVLGIAMAVVISKLMKVLGIAMCWYQNPWLIIPVYAAPLASAAIWVYTPEKSSKSRELAQYTSAQLILVPIILILTTKRVASVSILTFSLASSLLRFPILTFFGKNRSSSSIFLAQLICLFPVLLLHSSLFKQFADFIVPVLGRTGARADPDLVMAVLTMALSSLYIILLHNVLFLTSFNGPRCARILLSVTFIWFLIIAATPYGNPYRYQEDIPRLRRIRATHVDRTIYDENGLLSTKDNGIFLQGLDFAKTENMPNSPLFAGARLPNCSGIVDDFCRLPYIFPGHKLWPPKNGLWIPVNENADLPFPIKLTRTRKEIVNSSSVRLHFTLEGGYTKMALCITPLRGFKLAKYSFTDFDLRSITGKNTYFVALTYGAERPLSRNFWLELHSNLTSETQKNHSTIVELSVSAHHTHAPHQDTSSLAALRKEIAAQRVKSNDWRWKMMINFSGTSQIVVQQF